MDAYSDAFHRAESDWLNPPEYRPNPVDAEEDISRIKGEFREKADDFMESWLVEDIEEADHIETTIEAARDFIRDLEHMQHEMEDAEEILRCQPDPDAEYDNRGI